MRDCQSDGNKDECCCLREKGCVVVPPGVQELEEGTGVGEVLG